MCVYTQQEIMEFVDFLKNPNKYKELGAKIPKGESHTHTHTLSAVCEGELVLLTSDASCTHVAHMYVCLHGSATPGLRLLQGLR